MEQQEMTKIENKSRNPYQGHRADGAGKVFWNEGEREILVQATAAAWVTLDKPSMREALTIAQQVLPVERHRKIENLAFPDWLKEGLPIAVTKLAAKKAREEAAAHRATAQVVEKASAPAAVSAPYPPASSIAWTPIVSSAPDLRQQLVDGLASIISEALAKALGSAFAGMHFGPTPAPPPFVLPKPAAKVAKPKLLIVGLSNTQKVIIENEFHIHFDLKFISPDDSKDALRHKVNAGGTVIAMVDHISHAHTAIIQARTAGIIRLTGAVDALRNMLGNMLAEREHP